LNKKSKKNKVLRIKQLLNRAEKKDKAKRRKRKIE